MSPQHQRALSVLRYALMVRAGFCVVTGNVGAGKTTLVRSVLQNLDQQVEVGLVSNTQCDSFEEFLKWVLLAFDLEYRNKDKVELYDTLVGYLIERFEKGRPVTLIIDEAQHLGAEYLEQLRMLSNVNTERGQILQTILVGQPELWDLLRKPEMQQFAQRISYDYFLSPLDSAEITRDYILHRISEAGGNMDLFEPGTFDLIFKATHGVPRLINLVCDTALVYGYGEERRSIGSDLVEQVIKDKERSLSPLGPPAAETPELVHPSEHVIEELPVPGDAEATSVLQKRARKLSTIERAALRLKKQ
ncbi:MAG: AAA family ATPase [Pseudomonadales bacterium]|nr:AAA family ATPase [Pseudomonadales bacterium]